MKPLSGNLATVLFLTGLAFGILAALAGRGRSHDDRAAGGPHPADRRGSQPPQDGRSLKRALKLGITERDDRLAGLDLGSGTRWAYRASAATSWSVAWLKRMESGAPV